MKKYIVEFYVDVIRAEYENMNWKAAELVTDTFGDVERSDWVVR